LFLGKVHDGLVGFVACFLALKMHRRRRPRPTERWLPHVRGAGQASNCCTTSNSCTTRYACTFPSAAINKTEVGSLPQVMKRPGAATTEEPACELRGPAPFVLLLLPIPPTFTPAWATKPASGFAGRGRQQAPEDGCLTKEGRGRSASGGGRGWLLVRRMLSYSRCLLSLPRSSPLENTSPFPRCLETLPLPMTLSSLQLAIAIAAIGV